ncbi:hypothetical protein BT69DRAFT_1386167 [Atractiella rhizophila]|nr:hypothetical protein BT69DRAFT_1386167 [Atractiella rhizophila]
MELAKDEEDREEEKRPKIHNSKVLHNFTDMQGMGENKDDEELLFRSVSKKTKKNPTEAKEEKKAQRLTTVLDIVGPNAKLIPSPLKSFSTLLLFAPSDLSNVPMSSPGLSVSPSTLALRQHHVGFHTTTHPTAIKPSHFGAFTVKHSPAQVAQSRSGSPFKWSNKEAITPNSNYEANRATERDQMEREDQTAAEVGVLALDEEKANGRTIFARIQTFQRASTLIRSILKIVLTTRSGLDNCCFWQMRKEAHCSSSPALPSPTAACIDHQVELEHQIPAPLATQSSMSKLQNKWGLTDQEELARVKHLFQQVHVDKKRHFSQSERTHLFSKYKLSQGKEEEREEVEDLIADRTTIPVGDNPTIRGLCCLRKWEIYSMIEPMQDQQILTVHKIVTNDEEKKW